MQSSNGNETYQVRTLALRDITQSDTNPRTSFDDAALMELAESIRLQGVLQPVLVRPRTLWERVVSFVARQRAIFDAGATGYGLALSQFRDAGIPLDSQYEKAIDLLRKELRIEQVIGLNTYQPAQGAIQPIGDRDQMGAGPSCYELVAGERRWRASKLANLDTVPAIVRDLDDQAAIEIQVIENLQRADLSAIEEADGYASMLRLENDGKPVWTADSLAAKIGKSKSYVYARLKLCNVPDACRKALADGLISPSVAELIGRIPSGKSREGLWADLFRNADSEWFRPPTYRDARKIVERDYMRELKGAPFDQNDKKLLAAAGSCKACPKRTGNDRVQYPDGRADVCTDPGCFKLKVEAHQKREVEKLVRKGAKLLSADESKEIFGPYHLTAAGAKDYLDLEEEYYDLTAEANSVTTYGQLLAGLVMTEAIGTDQNSTPHRLVSRAAAVAALKEKGIALSPADSHGYDQEAYRKRQAEAAKQRKLREAVVVEASQAAGLAIQLKMAKPANLTELFRVLVGRMLFRIARSLPREFVALAKRRGVKIDPGEQLEQKAAAMADGLQSAEALALMAEALVIVDLDGWAVGYASDKPENPICAYAGVDLKAIEKRLSKDGREDKTAKAKRRRKERPTS